jgi:stage V sporulation protein AA
LEIYVKLAKKSELSNRDKILLQDVAEVFAPKEILQKINELPIVTIDRNKKDNYLIHFIDVIRTVDEAFPGNIMHTVGDDETVVNYKPHRSKEKPVITAVKVAFISVVIFMGASTAIMSFHTDASIPDTFKTYYYLFFGEHVDSPTLIYLPYSIGLAAGIILFFNHFAGKKITDDPTPIEVEMSSYENTVTDAKIDELNTVRSKSESQTGNGDDSNDDPS